MMARIKYIVMCMVAAIVALSFTSCEHKDLCYQHPHGIKLEVEFNWENAPEAAPGGMCLFFYPEDGGKPRRFDVAKDGGNVYLEVGKYNVVIYNNDSEYVRYSYSNYFDHMLYTRESGILEPIGRGRRSNGIPRPPDTSDESVRLAPDMMWGCSAMNIEVTDFGAKYTHEVIGSDKKEPQLQIDAVDKFKFIFYPEELMCRYTYEVINLKNIEYVYEVCGLLTGMSGTYTLATGEIGADCVSLPVEAFKDSKAQIINGEFHTFGHRPDVDKKHYMMMYFCYSDSMIYPFYWDLTDQVNNAPDPRRVHLVLDAVNVDLPDAIKNGSGFIPSVDDFNEVYEDIVM